MVNLFQNPIFRVVILFLILVRGYKDPQFAILVAISFVLIMTVINEQIFKEKFSELPITTPVIKCAKESEYVKTIQKESTELDSSKPENEQKAREYNDELMKAKKALNACMKGV